MRFSILTLLGLVAFAAVGCMAVVRSNYFWANVTYTTAFVILWTAVLAAIYQADETRAFWTGFAVFGMAYIYTEGLTMNEQLFSGWLADAVYLELEMVMPDGWAVYGSGYTTNHWMHSIVHSLLSLPFACVGGLTARYFYSIRQKQDAQEQRTS